MNVTRDFGIDRLGSAPTSVLLIERTITVQAT
jgi:hypothetical protein